VAPSYGDAQERLTAAGALSRELLPGADRGRQKDDSRAQPRAIAEALKTDHVDLYQFHALTKMANWTRCSVPASHGAMEAAKKEGKIRYIGSQSLSGDGAGGLDRYNFDTVLSAELGSGSQQLRPQI